MCNYLHDKANRLDDTYFNTLGRIETAVTGSRWSRFRLIPLRYATGMLANHVICPWLRSGMSVKRRTIFGWSMALRIPAHLDIYMFGCKTSPSDIALTRYLLRRIRSGMQIIDIGASAGFYSLLSAHRTGVSGIVFACDPGNIAFGLLRRNIAAIPHAVGLQVACGNDSGVKEFHEFPVRYAEYNTLSPDGFLKESRWYREHQPRLMNCPVTSLDSIVSSHGLAPDLIKIDAENSEREVVDGMRITAEKIQPEVIMRFWPRHRDHGRQLSAIEMLSGLGYVTYGLTAEGGLLPVHVPDEVRNYAYEYLILRHTDRGNVS